jgi:hypothetical protein
MSDAPVEALRLHLLATLNTHWDAPDQALAAMFADVDALAWRETGAMEEYVARFDTPAQELTGRGSPEFIEARRARFMAALARVRELADTGGSANWDALREVQAVVLGREVEFRSGPAFAHGGRERYGHWPDLEAMFTRKLEVDDADACHPVAKAARLYLDLIYVHPFEDGNARAARLWLEFMLRRARVPTPALGPLIKWPKRPQSVARYVAFQQLVARALLVRSA